MPSVHANGIDIVYDVHGAGPPAVVLHGATSVGSADFAAQIPLFSRAFLVHLPDARGHGRTKWDARGGFEYRLLVDDLEAFVDALGLQTFHLVGFSMGAMTALQFGARHPERLRTLVVIGITTHREPRLSVLRRLTDIDRVLTKEKAWADELARRHDPVQGEGAWQRLLPAITADVEVQPLLSPAELHRIDCPTMVVCGDRDPFVPVEHAAGIARQIPGGRLFVAPDCGHEVMVQRPGLFNEAMAGFYRATEAVAKARAGEGGHAEIPGTAVQHGAALTHPAPAEVRAPDDTDARWLDGRSRYSRASGAATGTAATGTPASGTPATGTAATGPAATDERTNGGDR